ncbi:pentapeptide repeat-containing protein [Paenibacillus hamazuiensis]|uniref:pentapeptide repeat-containing protein n=1 Tax=Paenibacillus hamazuiensis TaxID=2936508 RepID=UPI00200D8151|nr:pentapeptide repeat-containing protein [Paenibacillus hamazuiensis]
MSENNEKKHPAPGSRRLRLQADCGNCYGLCCVALPFAASSDFAEDKAAGQPCRNLQPDYRCAIHSKLRQTGFRGCTVYDCFGAGQQVSQVTFGGKDWRRTPETAEQMFEVFPVMRQLHELLWYLDEALTKEAAHPIRKELLAALEKTQRLTEQGPDSILQLDMASLRTEINDLLLRTSELVRAEAARTWKGASPRRKSYGRGADLIGAKLRGADLRAANLRGAYLIAADLREADLRSADLIGADVRDADLRGADLTGALFLTQFQINAAKGDAQTKLPPALTRPEHWSA